MSRRTNSGRSANTVDVEVANLMNLKNKNDFTNALLVLRQRYNDEDLVNKIQEVFTQRHASIVKAAKKFAVAVKAKYAQQNVPFHYLLMKARAHAKKHHLSEAEFSEFQRIYEQELSGTGSSEVLAGVTSLMKVLGNINSGTDSYFHVDEADYKNLQEILKVHDATKLLHSQVILQALQFQGFDTESVSGTYDRRFMDKVDYVHPVIAALFLPKLKYVEQQFLFSNIAGIVKSRYNRSPITTLPDYELFYNLVTDPNDVVCDTRTPVGDLLARCNLQHHLWKSVLHLRNGQYFHPSLREFLSSVDVCRLNKHDNPELVYGRHDGTIIKRLFSAFSFRPTTVSTVPVQQLFMYNPYSQVIRPTVTAVPMINVRVLSNTPVKIIDTLQQEQQFIEGNIITKRIANVMYSREIMVFYIDRRFFRYNMVQTPVNVLRLPTSVAGFERINCAPIDIRNYNVTPGSAGVAPTYAPTGNNDIVLDNGTTTYTLTSAVVADVRDAGMLNDQDPQGTKFVVGSYALFPDTPMGTSVGTYIPQRPDPTSGAVVRNFFNVSTELSQTLPATATATATAPGAPVPPPRGLSLQQTLDERAIILIYKNKADNAAQAQKFLYF
jgi:hypothetical protein